MEQGYFWIWYPSELKIEGKKIIKGNDFINSIQGKEIILY